VEIGAYEPESVSEVPLLDPRFVHSLENWSMRESRVV
jgi:hypothetical protein